MLAGLVFLDKNTIRERIITRLIITITIFSNLNGALTALFFTNCCVGLKSDTEIESNGSNRIEIVQLHQPTILR